MRRRDGARPDGRPARSDYSFEARFGKIIAAVGIAAIPRALYYYMGELGLSYADVGFIGHLLSFRWTSEVPFPGVEKLARQAGCRASTIQRRRQAIEELGYCAVVPRFSQGRQTSNGYDLSALFERLEACIRRDWQTIWKDRDPMVGDDVPDDDPFADHALVPGPVDNTPGDREVAALPGRDSAAPPGRAFATGAGRESGAPGAAPPRPHESHDSEDMRRRDERPGESKHDHQGAAIRAAEIRVVPPGSTSQDDGLPASVPVATALAAYAKDLRDGPRSRAGNYTRARRIWAASGLDEPNFLRFLARAHDRAQRAPVVGDGAAHAGSRMPYFFAVLEDLVDAARGDDLARAWRQVLRALRASLRPDVVRRWLDGARLASVERAPDGDALLATVVIPDRTGRSKLGAEYRHTLERALSSALGEPARAEVREPPPPRGRGG